MAAGGMSVVGTWGLGVKGLDGVATSFEGPSMGCASRHGGSVG
jgi:hypothetical protein